MNKTLLLVFALLFSASLMAQKPKRSIFLQESFDGTAIPEGWYVDGLGADNWSISASASAGGSPNELQMYWNPQFDGISRFVSPAFDLTGVESIVVSFKHHLDNYSGTNVIGIATTSDDGATWHEAWSEGFNLSSTFTYQDAIVTPDMGQPSVRLCLFFSGNSYNISAWYFDDIEVYSYENLDLGLKEIDIPNFPEAGPLYPSVKLFNYGATNISTMEVCYQVNDNETVTETFSVNIDALSAGNITFNTPVMLGPGGYNMAVNILKVNGTPDDNPDNDRMEKAFSVAYGTAQRIPMIEHFSSSTCHPCVAVDQAMLALTNNNPGHFTYTKYPMNWPGVGDLYYTEEAGVRRDYYGVIGVPMAFLDATANEYEAVTQATLDAEYALPALADIRGAFSIEGTIIHVTVDLASYVDLWNVRAYVSVNEKLTTGNIGDNGETEFHHVMMKLLPDAEGTTLDIKGGEYQRLEFTFDMASTHVEEMDDLEVSVWLQDDESKEIFNSHFLYEYVAHPYPVENLTLVRQENSNAMTLSWDAPAQGTPSAYNVFVNGTLVEAHTQQLNYTFTAEEGVFYVAEVQSLYADGMTSVKVVALETEETAVAESTSQTLCRLYPNPANTRVHIEAESPMQQVEVFDLLGNCLQRVSLNGNTLELNLSHCSNGVYFVNILQSEGSSTHRLVITK